MTRFAITLAAIGIFGGAVWAAPITYTESGQLTGTLGTTTLTNVAFTFTFNGDTANIVAGGPPNGVINPATSSSFLIGLSSGSFIDTLEVANNQVAGALGFLNVTASGAITFINAGAVGYGLATPISVATAGSTSGIAAGPIATSAGALVVRGAQNLSFTATTVPEPTSAALLGAGLLALTSRRRKRL